MNKKGIAIGGNIFVDRLKKINFYPPEGMLAPILGEELSVGGCVSNTAISLKRLSPETEVRAVGCVGEDGAGSFVTQVYRQNGLDTRQLRALGGVPTGTTDVYASPASRTFFVNPGANAHFGPEHVDLDALDVSMLHIGYVLLLGRMDGPDRLHGTVLAGFLRDARQRGIRTSVDVVSEDSDRFSGILPAALPHCDNLILNEIEAGRTVGIPARGPDGSLLWENLPHICDALIDLGVKENVILHCPEAGILMDSSKSWWGVRSLALPKGYIKGSVGAGDAFCAGALLGLHRRLSPIPLLQLANCAAAGCLSAADGTSGVRAEAEMLALRERYAPNNEIIKE